MKFEYIKWHNNYDFKIGQLYDGYIYKEGWISIDGQLYRAECFKPVIEEESEKRHFIPIMPTEMGKSFKHRKAVMKYLKAEGEVENVK